MASHITYDPIGTGGRPQSPETEEIQLHSPLADDQEEDPYAAGFLDPDILPTIRAINQPPDLDIMPVPISHLPAGAQPPSRFYSALGTVDEPYARDSFASSAHDFSTPPRPGYRDSDYGSVSRLRPDSTFGSLATSTSESPRVTSFGTYRDDPSASTANFAMDDIGGASVDKRELYATPREKRSRRLRTILITCLILVLIAAAIGALLYFFVFKKKSSQNNATTPGSTTLGSSSGSHTATQSTGGSGSPTSNVVITGGDGSTLVLDSGATMTYTNKLGGYWYYDQNDPFNGAARAQSYTPPLNQSWQYGVDRIFGVNLGGWFNTEPFISPALYEPYLNAATPAIDEWTLSVNMAADTANGGLNRLENHYATFITEEDFAVIAGAGLNWVRIPFPYWGVAKFPGEPFLEGVAWKYFLKAIAWARKYGIRINLDLHAVPGSQNAFNHSGKMGTINWLYGVMGIANAQRSLDTIRVIAEFISQPQYSDVVVMFGLINEPQVGILGRDIIGHFYYQAYNIIRNITGIGNGPFISIHDGFMPEQSYTGFLSGADRIALDTHPYLCFQTLNTDGPAAQALRPCPAWGANINTTMANFGMMTAGEWSLGYTDCGLFLNGVGEGTRYEGNLTTFPSNKLGNCADILDWPNWSATYKQGLQLFAQASSDALQNAFFWTWKIGNSSVTGKVESPHWSYRLGFEQGWMPPDPRSAAGTCASQGVNSPFNGPLQSWQTGGPGAGTIAPTQISLYQAWPPASLSASGGPINNAAVLPTYTPTGSLTTLPPPTLTMRSSSATINAGNGWHDPSDTASAYTPIAGCSYPDGWNAGGAAAPTAACTGARRKRGEQARDFIPRAAITARP